LRYLLSRNLQKSGGGWRWLAEIAFFQPFQIVKICGATCGISVCPSFSAPILVTVGQQAGSFPSFPCLYSLYFSGLCFFIMMVKQYVY
jgi:hypothetical protein